MSDTDMTINIILGFGQN